MLRSLQRSRRRIAVVVLSTFLPVLPILCGGCGDASESTPAGAVAGSLVLESLPSFRRAGAVAPQVSGKRTQQAEGLIGSKQYGAARKLLEAELAEKPDAGRARFLLAYSHHKEKRYAEARPHFEAVLRGGPTFERAHTVFYLYGWCLWYLGETSEAAAAFEAMLEFDPSERDAHYGLGLIALEGGRLDAAAEHLQRSIEICDALQSEAPGDQALARQLRRDVAKARARLADIELAHDRPESAKEQLEASVELHPASYETWFKLSRVLTRLGDDKGAAQALRIHKEWKRKAGQ